MQYKAAMQILKTLLAERKITEEDYQRVRDILAKECVINSCSIFLDSCPIIR
ncbi:SHOCT domain-containing protein [Ruminococcus callidus]